MPFELYCVYASFLLNNPIYSTPNVWFLCVVSAIDLLFFLPYSFSFFWENNHIDTTVPFVAIIFIFFEKNGRANAVLSAIFHVLHSAKLQQMPSSTIFVAIIYVVKLRQMEIVINSNYFEPKSDIIATNGTLVERKRSFWPFLPLRVRERLFLGNKLFSLKV